jgi:replicative DNA helicase
MLDVADKLQQGKADTSWVLDQFEKTCNINLTTDIGLDLYHNPEKLIKELNSDEPVIPSKWEWLDEKLNGGFMQNGRALYIFAGQANVGKSIVLGNVAKNIAEQGKTVLLVTLEMSEIMYAKRIASSATKIPVRTLREESESLQNALEEIREKNPRGRILIKEFPPSTITPNQLSSFIKTLRNKGIFVDAVVLDYLNLLHTTYGNNSYEKVKHLSEQTRALSYVYNCPFITATQLNRSGYDVAEPTMQSLSESYGLATTGDFIASVYQLEEDAEQGVMRIAMMKNRFGPNFGSSAFRIDYSTLTLKEDHELASMVDSTESARDVLASLAD